MALAEEKRQVLGHHLEEGLAAGGWQGAIPVTAPPPGHVLGSWKTLRISCLICNSIWATILLPLFVSSTTPVGADVRKVNLQIGTASEGMGQIYIQLETNQKTSICTVNTPECVPIIVKPDIRGTTTLT